jgi:gamma-glutamyl:cysteine ligase YbdK (ATP-grasp superfamily)
LDKKDFINQLQQVCIEESVEHDIKLLSSSEPELCDLAHLLQKSDSQTKEAIEKLMHFTAKNSVAALLHLIDMQFTLKENTDELNKTELLDMFLQQCSPEQKARP